MSDGTADQLYLALRLASLETYLDDHEPIPLVVDDILVNFDDARALAALRPSPTSRGGPRSSSSPTTTTSSTSPAPPWATTSCSSTGWTIRPARVNGHAEAAPVEAVKPRRKKKAAPAAEEG